MASPVCIALGMSEMPTTSVCYQVFFVRSSCTQSGVCIDCILCQSADSVCHRISGTEEVTGDIPDTAGASELFVDSVVVYFLFCKIIDTESL